MRPGGSNIIVGAEPRRDLILRIGDRCRGLTDANGPNASGTDWATSRSSNRGVVLMLINQAPLDHGFIVSAHRGQDELARVWADHGGDWITSEPLQVL